MFLNLDLTQNLKYDRLTKAIMKRHLKRNFNCIDVGCHKGAILNLMLKFSPDGVHYAFEPIPYLFEALELKYKNKAKIFPYALSYSNGETTFYLVKNAPAYSGIKRRQYDISNPDIEEISVTQRALDDIATLNEPVHFIKIDVEGGEFDMLKGAKNLLKKHKPILLFECGKGASDYYGTAPSDFFNFLTYEIGYKIYTLKSYSNGKSPMSVIEFENYFTTNKEYYFIAAYNS